jgi:hypothetical protein
MSLLLSIPTKQLLPLLSAISKQYPGWDRSSQALQDIFKERKIDPKIAYPKFYVKCRNPE